MAKGHRYLGPRWVVLPDDPAVDEKASDAVKYRESLFADGLVLREGVKPTRWQVQPLTIRQKRWCLGSDDRVDAIVRCGLLAVDGYVIEAEDGTITSPRPPDRKDRGGDVGVASSKEWLDEFPLHTSDAIALAGMILAITEPDPLSCRPSGGPSGAGKSGEKESTA